MAKFLGNHDIGTHSFNLDTVELRDATGQLVPLRAQSADVLAHLVSNGGNLVSKSDMMEKVWPDTFVTDDSLVKCISDIRKALGEDGRLLVTLPKRGYRLEIADTAAAISEPAKIGPPKFHRRTIASVFAISAIILGLLSWIGTQRSGEATNLQTIAVLPFRNASGDPEQRYLSNGVAVDLIAALSQISDLRVVAQGASFTYSPDTEDVRSIASKLDANVILEGSVRQVGDALRLTTALVDGETGANLWAEQYDGDRGDLLAFQSGVLKELVRVLSVRLSRSERARLGVRGTTNIAAHDAYLRARELENLYTNDTNAAAETALNEAIQNDPEFALPYAHLSQVYSFRVENNWTEDRSGAIDAAFEAAEKSVKLDPKLPFARFALGRLFTRSYAHHLPNAIERAKEEFRVAMELDPNYVNAYVFLANIHIFDGEAEKALPLIDAALKRNPVPPYWYALAEGMARYFLGEYDVAERFLISARDQNPTAPFPHRYLIATYGMLDRIDDAEWAGLEYEALGRTATVDAMVSSASISNQDYRELFAIGLRNAGLPET